MSTRHTDLETVSIVTTVFVGRSIEPFDAHPSHLHGDLFLCFSPGAEQCALRLSPFDLSKITLDS